MFHRRNSAPGKTAGLVAAMGIVFGVFMLGVMSAPASAQYQDRDRDYDRITRIEPGTLLAVRRVTHLTEAQVPSEIVKFWIGHVFAYATFAAQNATPVKNG